MKKQGRFLDILGRRGDLSMVGKGIIGLVGGIILLPVMWNRSCNKKRRDGIPKSESWVEHNVKTPLITLSGRRQREHFLKLGLQSEGIDSVIRLLRSRVSGGMIIHELREQEIDSLNSHYNLAIVSPKKASEWVLFLKSTDSSDAILRVSNEHIDQLILLP